MSNSLSSVEIPRINRKVSRHDAPEWDADWYEHDIHRGEGRQTCRRRPETHHHPRRTKRGVQVFHADDLPVEDVRLSRIRLDEGVMIGPSRGARDTRYQAQRQSRRSAYAHVAEDRAEGPEVDHVEGDVHEAIVREGRCEHDVVAVLFEVAQGEGEFVRELAQEGCVGGLLAIVPGAEDESVGADEQLDDGCGAAARRGEGGIGASQSVVHWTAVEPVAGRFSGRRASFRSVCEVMSELLCWSLPAGDSQCVDEPWYVLLRQTRGSSPKHRQ